MIQGSGAALIVLKLFEKLHVVKDQCEEKCSH